MSENYFHYNATMLIFDMNGIDLVGTNAKNTCVVLTHTGPVTDYCIMHEILYVSQ